MVKPRLLVVGPTYAIATNRRKLWALAEYFDIACATSTLNGSQIFGQPAEEFEETGHKEPIALYRFKRTQSHQDTTRALYKGINKLFRTERFDWVLADNEPWGLIKWQAWLLTRRFQQKARFGEFSWENVERTGLKGLVLSWFYRLSVLADDFVICGNRGCHEIFVKHGAQKRPMLIAPQLGVDTVLYRPASLAERASLRKAEGLPENVILIGYCGRLAPEKGTMELIEAVEILRQTFRELHLAVVGEGPCRKELVARKRPWLHLLDARPHFEIPNFMRALDLFVLPSKPLKTRASVWEEQFGHVLIEAMACEVVTIGSDSGAIPEVLGDPRVIFPHSRPSRLAGLIETLVRDQTLKSAIAKEQRNRVLKLFSHEAVAKTYAEFLLEMK